MIKFNDVDQAKTAIAKALSEDNWQKYVLLNQDGDMKDLYVEKEHAKWFNDVVSFGSFDSEEQGEKLLLECLNSRLDEIVHWLVKGNNMPLKLYFTLYALKLDCIGLVYYHRLHIKDSKYLFSRGESRLESVELLCKGLYRVEKFVDVHIEGDEDTCVDNLTEHLGLAYRAASGEIE